MTNKVNKTPGGFTHFRLAPGGAIAPVRGEDRSHTRIPPGIYTIGKDMETGLTYFVPASTTTDDLIDLPSTVSAKVLKEVDAFWSEDVRSRFDELGLVYKRGILLHGAPGTGKTCTIVQVMRKIVDQGGIVIFNPEAELLSKALDQAREVQPDLRVLVVFEEFEKIANDEGILHLLDGELQVEDVVYVATTNYFDRIPDRIKNRPSRFATVLQVGPPDAEARGVYLRAKLPAALQPDIKEWVKRTDNLVIDQIKDLIVSVYCFGLTLKDALKKLRAMGAYVPEEDDEDGDVGKARKGMVRLQTYDYSKFAEQVIKSAARRSR